MNFTLIAFGHLKVYCANVIVYDILIFYRMTSKKKNKSKHKKKKGNFDNAEDSLRILLQGEALVYCKLENYEKAIRQYTAVIIFIFIIIIKIYTYIQF